MVTIIHMTMKKHPVIITSALLLSMSIVPTTFAFQPSSITGMQGHVATQGGQQGLQQACQMHAADIKNKLSHILTLTANIETVFDTHATQVENYYTTKVVPNGVTVANYSALVGNIATSKAGVTTALATVQTDVVSFSCSASDPRALLTTFKVNMRSVATALQAYRTSIKNLIVAVRSANGKANSKNQLTPKPTHTVSTSPTAVVTHP